MKSFITIRILAGLAGLVASVGACSADDTTPSESTESEVSATARATLDGYWKRAEGTNVVGITFNKCVGLDGATEIDIGAAKRKCVEPNPDVGSYLVYGAEGAILEAGSYQIDRLPRAGEPGVIAFFMKGKTTSYPREYRIILTDGHASHVELAQPGGADLARFAARSAEIPPSCAPGPHRVTGKAFLGTVDFNFFRHDYTGGQRGDEFRLDDLLAKRPFRFGYPACNVTHTNGIVDTDHYDAICDGVFDVKVNQDTRVIAFTDKTPTFPRFYSLAEGLSRAGGDVGTALTPLVDLQGRNVQGCEVALDAGWKKAIATEEQRMADAHASGNRSVEDSVRSYIDYLRRIERGQRISNYSDNACKVLLADSKKIIPQVTGQPAIRFAQIFTNAVFVSTGVASGDQCLVNR